MKKSTGRNRPTRHTPTPRRRKPKPARRLVWMLAIPIGFAACLSDEPTLDTIGQPLDTAATDAEEEPGALPQLPPGEIIDTQPQAAWTEGAFSVSHDGAAEYRLPLWVPDGRGSGLEPELALHYNSRGGNGILGVGWSLTGLSSITPCPRTLAHDGHIAQVSHTGADAYCMDGQRLRPHAGDVDGALAFRTEHDTFSRILARPLPGSSNAQPANFHVLTKDGRILIYGEDGNALVRVPRLSGNIADPEDPVLTPGATVTVAWALRRIEDRNGNAITIDYLRTAPTSSNLWAMELLPFNITYGPNRSVRFHYESRPDLVDHFYGGLSGGVHTQIQRRLLDIEMYDGPNLLRRYRFSYQNESITGRSLLTRVQECDPSDVCLNALEFDWSPGSWEFDDVPMSFNLPSHPTTQFTFGDVNGDGAYDLLYSGLAPDPRPGAPGRPNVWQMRLSNRTTGFSSVQELGISNIEDLLHRPKFRTIDYDLDGRMDLLTEVPGAEGTTRFALYRSLGTSYQIYAPGIDETRVGTEAGQTNSAYFTDLDGNGLPDYLSPRIESDTSQRWFYRFNSETGFGAVGRSQEVTQFPAGQAKATDFNGDGRANLLVWDTSRYRGLGEFAGVLSAVNVDLPFILPSENFDRQNLHLADVNCDSLQDAIYPFSGLGTRLNSGQGFSRLIDGPTDYMNPSRNGRTGNRGVRIVDFNNDGCDDVLLLHDGVPTDPDQHTLGMQLYVWRSNRFVRIPLMRPAPAFTTIDEIQPIDFDGDSAIDLTQVDEASPHNLKILRRRGGQPDQLVRVKVEGLGPRVEVEYTTLAGARHASCSSEYPLMCPQRGGSIVASHWLANGLGGAEPWHQFDHRYSAARVDLRGRGWLGFEQHTVTDRENGAETRTQFNNTARRDLDLGGRTAICTRLPICHIEWSTTSIAMAKGICERSPRATASALVTHRVSMRSSSGLKATSTRSRSGVLHGEISTLAQASSNTMRSATERKPLWWISTRNGPTNIRI